MAMLSRLRTIWKKTLRELARNRGRTVMVVLSVAVGVLAVGTIAAAQQVLEQDLYSRYADINPAHIRVKVPQGIGPGEVEGLETVPGVQAVQGRTVFNSRYRLPGNTSKEEVTWEVIELMAFPGDWEQSVNAITPESGPWPPERGQMLAERSALEKMGVSVGDTVLLDAGDREIAFVVAGTAHQQDELTATVRGGGVAFVSNEDMRRLRGSDSSNVLFITVSAGESPAEVAQAVRQRLELAGHTVGGVTLLDPQQHPADEVLTVLFLVMTMLAVLALILSTFLVTNTIDALITQQISQIGVMKAIGADSLTVSLAYSLTVLAYGLLGTVLAVPMANRAGYRLAEFCAVLLNIDLYPYRFSPTAVALMAAVGLLVPFVAAAKSLRRGAKITVREAVSSYGLGGGSGENALSRLLAGIRGLPRVWALALRNAVRVPGRLLLTLTTLTLAGGIFIAVLSTNSSFDRTVHNLLYGQYGIDSFLVFVGEERASHIVAAVQEHPEVARAEAWYMNETTMVLASGQEVTVTLQAGPAASQLYHPRLQAGRWLAPEDGNAIVVNSRWADEEGVQVGDSVWLDVSGDGSLSEWVVVGINQDVVRQRRGVFVPLESLEKEMKQADHTVTMRVQYTSSDPADQERITAEVIAMLGSRGMEVFSAEALSHLEAQVRSLYRVLVVFLLSMSLLIALVGGLGLMGMMSINVLERRKEIGVMRAIGADGRAIRRIFWGETMVIALCSYLLSLALSLPLSRWMARQVGIAFIKTPLDFSYAAEGALLWLVIVLVVGTLASIIPAANAARLSVRESLSYE